MNKKIISILIFISAVGSFIVIVFWGVWLSDADYCAEAVAEKTLTVTFTDKGVTPACSIIASGETVTWVNEREKTIQLSSNPHPAHTDNPEISDGKFVINIEPGQKADVILRKKGTFGFHDHIKPKIYGKIIVK